MTFELPIGAPPLKPPPPAHGAMPHMLARQRPRLDPQAPLVDNIARVIGAGLTTRLIAAYGGHRLYIPQNPAPGDPIAATVGHPAAIRLGAVFGGERVWLPNGAGRKKRMRIADLRRRGATVPHIAREIGCSERYVYKVLRQLREDRESQGAPSAASAAREHPPRPQRDRDFSL
jgi:Homeodomain-like domain